VPRLSVLHDSLSLSSCHNALCPSGFLVNTPVSPTSLPAQVPRVLPRFLVKHSCPTSLPVRMSRVTYHRPVLCLFLAYTFSTLTSCSCISLWTSPSSCPTFLPSYLAILWSGSFTLEFVQAHYIVRFISPLTDILQKLTRASRALH